MVSLPIDVQLFVQSILYFTAVMTGLVTAVPMGITFGNLGNKCILYASVDWYNRTYFTTSYGSSSACHFGIYINVFLCILYAFGMGCYYAYATYKSRSDQTIATQMWVMPFILSTTLVTVLLFISACVVSVGFALFCQAFVQGKNVHGCADVQRSDFLTSYKAGTFFNFMTVAQTASWIGFLVWLFQLGLTILRFARNRRLRSQDSFVTGPNAPDTTQIAKSEPTA